MKKWIIMLWILTSLLLLVPSCSGNTEPHESSRNPNLETSGDKSDQTEETTDQTKESTKPQEPERIINTIALSDLVKMVYDTSGISMDNFCNIEVNAENLAYYFGTDFEFEEAFASEPNFGGGYSFCLVRVDPAKTKEIAQLIETNADPWKWICMGAEKVVVATNGNVVMLCMASSEQCSALKAAFLAIK